MKIPHSNESEENVLGSIMISKDAIYKISLTPSDFYNPTNRLIFSAMCKLRDRNEAIDLVSIGNELRDNLTIIGGHTKLVSLTGRVPTSAHIISHAKTVKREAYKRDLLNKTFLLRSAIEEDNDIEKYKKELLDSDMCDLKPKTIKELADEFSDDYNIPIINGLMTGLPKIDHLTGGFRAGEVITFTADSGVGKSNALLNIAVYNLKLGKKILYFNLEMSNNDVITRMIAMYNGLDAFRIRQKTEDVEKVMNGLAKLYDTKFKLITEGKITSAEIINQAYIEQKRSGLDLLIVDYLNEIKDNTEDEKINLNMATGNLRDCAIRLGVPVLTAYQMDKFARRLNEVPKKEDARGSTVVADRASVMFAIVNESRKCEGYDYRDPDPDQIKIHVMKNRSGGTGMAFKDILFDKRTLLFYEPVDNLVAMAIKI